jgi:hypothetical protein
MERATFATNADQKWWSLVEVKPAWGTIDCSTRTVE